MSLERKIRNHFTFVEAEEILTMFKKFDLNKLIDEEIEEKAEEYAGNTEF
jgi:hypothetical protein